jgi:hypothetical protein
MPSGRFSKQADAKTTGRFFNSNNAGDPPVIGGALTTAPAGLVASQGIQTMPGDRIIYSPFDVIAMSDPAIGNMGTATFRYVATLGTSVSSPTRGHACFWVTGGANLTQDSTYQVTSDEPANNGVSFFAGAFISNNLTKGNMWWIQESGKALLSFRNVITGTPTIGAGVYLAAAGNNANAVDVGAFDQLTGAGNATLASVDNALTRYIGPAETLPANNNTAWVDMTVSRASFRW